MHYHPASCIEEHPISCISNLWSCFKICDIATAKEDQSHEGWKWHLLQPFQTKCLEKLAIIFYKINSVQEACDKCFAVHILEFEILQIIWKIKQNKKLQNTKSIDEKLKTKSPMFFVWCFHVICKVSNFNMWTAKHLAQASCTDF